MKPRKLSAAWVLLAVAAGVLFLWQLLCVAAQATEVQIGSQFVWKQSFPVRWGDPSVGPIGGTEVRDLVVFDHKVFAAIGYWMDTEAYNPALPGAQVLRLDDPKAPWQIDLELRERNPRGLRLYEAVSTLKPVRFTVDSNGQQLASPVDMLLAAVWKRGPGLDVFTRAAGGQWAKTTIPDVKRQQIRALTVHKDKATGAELVFAGARNVIFVGGYDRQEHNIVWKSSPEWHQEIELPQARGRVASFAECNGKLYATEADTIYERVDGATPAWRSVFQTSIRMRSPKVTGLRGLTCIRDPSGSGNALLVSIEDIPARIYRIALDDGSPAGQYRATLELNVSAFLTRTLGMRTTFAIVAYNEMTEYRTSKETCPDLLIGLEAVSPDARPFFGRIQFNHWNPNGYYLVRDCGGNYALQEVRDFQIEPAPWLESVRTIVVSPFPTDPPGSVYAGGFDTNVNPVHNTGWLYKGVPKAAAAQ